jgi:hypothetical protein
MASKETFLLITFWLLFQLSFLLSSFMFACKKDSFNGFHLIIYAYLYAMLVLSQQKFQLLCRPAVPNYTDSISLMPTNKH